jgi:two-component system NtrC family sensor kinase
MKKLLRPISLSIVAPALIGLLVFLYARTQSVDVAFHNEVSNQLRTLKQLDAEWNLDVLRSKTESNKNYDPVTRSLSAIASIQEQLDASAAQLNPKKLKPVVDDLKAAIAEKNDHIDAFKTQNSVLKNSLRFLPTATGQLQELIAATPGQVGMLSDLHSKAGELLTEVLKFNLTPDAALRQNIEAAIAYLEAQQNGYPESLVEPVRLLISHGRAVMRQKEREERVLAAIAAVPTAQKVDQLAKVFEEQYNNVLKEQETFSVLLLGYSIFLLIVLACLGWELWRSYRVINQANASLKEANETLEQKVYERTEELSHALADLKESQAQLVQSEKMASLGQMVAGIAHEINTPLAYVKSGIEIARTRMDDVSALVSECAVLNTMLKNGDVEEEVLAHQFERVNELISAFVETGAIKELGDLMKDGLHGIEQISEIVVNLKNFSRLDRARFAEFNVNDGLESTLAIAKNVVKDKKIRKLYRDVKAIHCSPSQINQIFLNLITNAAQATDECGEITLATKQVHDYVRIEVVDNGTGIPEEIRPKIFDPFFTTKKVGEGTGLGLSIVQRIVKEHGGKITLHSKVGVGTKFSVLLPVKMPEPEIEVAMAA